MREMIKKAPETSKDQAKNKSFLTFAVFTLLLLNFVIGYFAHKYFSDSLLKVNSPGFWLAILNFAIITGIVLIYKHSANWKWSKLGLGKPSNWWQPILVAAGTYGAVILYSKFAGPLIMELGDRPNINHLMPIRQNLPMLLLALTMVWVTAAFLEEFIFRAFMINALDKLMGEKAWSKWLALVLSSVIFGLLHAYQGLTGILMTGSIGFIFGLAFLVNGRRIWPLILIHGLIDTMALFSIYHMEV